jgi:hypothetical protein
MLAKRNRLQGCCELYFCCYIVLIKMFRQLIFLPEICSGLQSMRILASTSIQVSNCIRRRPCLRLLIAMLCACLGRIATLILIAFQLPTDGRFVYSNPTGNLHLLMTHFLQPINLVSLCLGKLYVGSYKCSFDLAVREALILPQLASLSAIKVALVR